MQIKSLNTYNNSPERAFEALSSQLFEGWIRRSYNDLSYFTVVNGAGGDGGVEAYALTNKNIVIGLQAKWFLSSIQTNQINQIKSSILTAKKVRCNLARYIICLPRTPQSKRRVKGNKISENTEENRLNKLKEEIRKLHPDLQVEYWFEDRLIKEIGRNENEGLVKFWFKREEISIEELRTRFDIAKSGWLLERYVPDLHQSGLIKERISEMLQIDSFKASKMRSIEEILNSIKDTNKYIQLYIQQNKRDREINNELIEIQLNLDLYKDELKKLWEGLKTSTIVRPLDIPEVPVWKTKHKIEQQSVTSTLKNTRLLLIKVLDKIHQVYLPQYLMQVYEVLSPHNYIILGPVGSGKTHALSDAVEQQLAKGLPGLMIRAKDSPCRNWKDILQYALGGCNEWSDTDILSGLNSLARRISIQKASGKKKKQEFCNENIKLLICIDGIDEAAEFDLWQDRINETKLWLNKFPHLRFIFSSRSYPPTNQNPCNLPYDNKAILRFDVPDSGDSNLKELVPIYFDHYNITYSDSPWITSSFENALTLRLFCERYEGEDISSYFPKPIINTLKELLDYKIKRLEKEFIKINNDLSINERIIGKTLVSIAKNFEHHNNISKKDLRNKVFEHLDQVIDKTKIGNLLDLLSNNSFINIIPLSDDSQYDTEEYYTIGIQSYFEYIIASELAKDIILSQSTALPPSLLDVRYEYIRLLTAITLFLNHGILVGENGYWKNELDENRLLRIQLDVLSKSPTVTVLDYLPHIKSLFLRSNTFRDLVISHFVLPNASRVDLNIIEELVHKTLIEFENTYQRDLFWSSPDYHDIDGNSHLSLYLEYENIFIFSKHNQDPLLFAWSLSSINKIHREKARLELTNWAKYNLDEFIKLLNLIFFCGDPQIQEDLSIVIYSIAPTMKKSDEGISSLVEWVNQNIFADERISNIYNSIVRHCCRCFIERAFFLDICAEAFYQKAIPPYPTIDNLLPLSSKKVNSTDGTFPVEHDLYWNVIKESFESFFNYSNGGLDEEGQIFLLPYHEIYHDNFNQLEFSLKAALEYINQLGWNKIEGYGTDGSSQFATFEEKYTWLAVHHIQGYLADRLSFKDNKENRLLDDYNSILSVSNAAFSDFVTHIEYHIPDRTRWIVPEEIAPEMILTNDSLKHDVKAWTTADIMPSFNKWINQTNLEITGPHESSDDWLALYMDVMLAEPNKIGRARLRITCLLINEDEYLDFKTFIINNKNNFNSNNISPDKMLAGISGNTYHSLLDVLYRTSIIEYNSENIFSNKDHVGFSTKHTITKLTENSASGDSYLQIPSKLSRELLDIVTTDKRGYFDSKGKIKSIEFKVKESSNEYQNFNFADRISYLNALEKKKLVPFWVAEYFRSTISQDLIENNDAHWQNCRKWIIWNDSIETTQLHNDYHC